MGQNELVNCLKKRDLLNRQDVPRETLLQYAEQYKMRGCVYDAVDFLEKARDQGEFQDLYEIAEKDGDVFLLHRLNRILDRESTPEQWIKVANRARELGKVNYAIEAFRRAGAMDEAERAQNENSDRVVDPLVKG